MYGNISLPEHLVVSGFESEESMRDAEIKYIYLHLHKHVNDPKCMINNGKFQG